MAWQHSNGGGGSCVTKMRNRWLDLQSPIWPPDQTEPPPTLSKPSANGLTSIFFSAIRVSISNIGAGWPTAEAPLRQSCQQHHLHALFPGGSPSKEPLQLATGRAPTRVAEVGSVSASAKMATQIFLSCVIAIFAKNASLLRIIAFAIFLVVNKIAYVRA